VEAFEGLETGMRCVVVGDAAYERRYVQTLQATDDPRVVFTGYVFGEGYEELCSNAYLFVETSGVGGTHPALLEAMALGNCVVVNDTPENQETIGQAGLCYDGKLGAPALRGVLSNLIANPSEVRSYRRLAQARIGECYNWEDVTTQYERLFERLLTGEEGRP
jgi:glycosyltransferase involved in cell wall biosynthesis